MTLPQHENRAPALKEGRPNGESGGFEQSQDLKRERSSRAAPAIPHSVSHEGSHQVPVVTYLREAHVPAEKIARVFQDDGSWIFPSQTISPLSSTADITPTDANLTIKLMLDHACSVYELAQASLAHINPFGYNDHGPIHITRVTQNAISLANAAKLSKLDVLDSAISAIIHDLGNLFSREDHSLISPRMAAEMFPALTENASRWQRIQRSVELHNSGQYRPLLKTLAGLNPTERLAALRQEFTSIGLALIVADKVDVGRTRVNDKALEPHLFSQHGASHYNMYLQSEGPPQLGADNILRWQITFRADLTKEEAMGRFAQLAVPSLRHESGFRAYFPTSFHESLTSGDSFFESSIQKFWRLGGCASLRAIECGLALFDGTDNTPKANGFEVVFRDPGAKEYRPQEQVFRFSRENLLEQFAMIEGKYPRTSTKGF